MLKRISKVLPAIILLALASVPVVFAQDTIEQIIARVNGDIILKSEYEARKKMVHDELTQAGLQGAQLEQVYQANLKDLLRDMIDETLVLQQAKEMGLTADLELVKTMEKLRVDNKLDSMEALEKAISQQMNLEDFKQNIRTKYLKNQVLSREVYYKVIISTEDLRNYYDAHQKDFDRPAGVHLREISVSTQDRKPEEIEAQRKKLEEALAALKKGDDFGDVAQKFSESATAQSGGDIGLVEQGQLSPQLEEVVSKLTKGQVSDIITIKDGLMIVKLEDRHNGGILPFDIAQNEIHQILLNQRAAAKEREYYDKLRDEGFVEVREGYVDTGAVSKTEKPATTKGGNRTKG